MSGWATEEQLMMDEEPESDLLAGLFGPDSSKVFDNLIDLLADDEDLVVVS